jgi:cell division septation protein DedD
MTAPVAPQPAAVSVPRAPDAAHRVQLGAFSSTQLADSEWARLQGQYAELKPLKSAVSPVQTPRGRLYRLQATVASEQAARQLCAKLKSMGQACIVAMR